MACKKQTDCRHQWDDHPHCQPAYRNHYDCLECDTQWKDEWSCGSDDECPKCGRDTSPTDTVRIATCACEYLGR